MGKELTYGKMDQNIQVTSKMTIAMDMARCSGKMEGYIKENGSTEYKKIQ